MSSPATTHYARGTIKIPLAQAEGLISATLMAEILFIFLMGIYTVVYFGTIYLDFTKRGPKTQRWIVLSAITLIYLQCVSLAGTTLHSLKDAFIDHGATRANVFNALIHSPRLLGETDIVLRTFPIVISDGLLLWRCFHLWNRSWGVIAFPLLLTVSEMVLLIPRIFLGPIYGHILNSLTSAFLFVSAGSTIITAVLISYRVHTATSMMTVRKSKARFRHIFHILIESAAIYAIITLIGAIFVSIPSMSKLENPNTTWSLYISPMQPLFAGLMPTIMVARIIAARSEETNLASMTHISGLQFQSQQQSGGRDQSQLHGSRGGRVHTIDLEIGISPLGQGEHEKKDGRLDVRNED